MFFVCDYFYNFNIIFFVKFLIAKPRKTPIMTRKRARRQQLELCLTNAGNKIPPSIDDDDDNENDKEEEAQQAMEIDDSSSEEDNDDDDDDSSSEEQEEEEEDDDDHDEDDDDDEEDDDLKTSHRNVTKLSQKHYEYDDDDDEDYDFHQQNGVWMTNGEAKEIFMWSKEILPDSAAVITQQQIHYNTLKLWYPNVSETMLGNMVNALYFLDNYSKLTSEENHPLYQLPILKMIIYCLQHQIEEDDENDTQHMKNVHKYLEQCKELRKKALKRKQSSNKQSPVKSETSSSSSSSIKKIKRKPSSKKKHKPQPSSKKKRKLKQERTVLTDYDDEEFITFPVSKSDFCPEELETMRNEHGVDNPPWDNNFDEIEEKTVNIASITDMLSIINFIYLFDIYIYIYIDNYLVKLVLNGLNY